MLPSTEAETFSTGADPPLPAASNVAVRMVITLVASKDLTVWIAFPA